MADVKTNPLKIAVIAGVLLMFALAPAVAAYLGQSYYVTLFARIMIYAIAAVALNFVLGFGGLTSLGHALYLGIGAYAVGIMEAHGVFNGYAQLAMALVAGAFFAGIVGLIVVRMSGMSFIMITLAFAQMGYFLAISLKNYGGEDGRSIETRSSLFPLDLASNTTLYYLIFAVLLATLWLLSRMVQSKFGMVLRGCKENERRMLALGFKTLRYKLVAYIISALIVVVAGYLLANLTSYASPAYFQWTVSADLVIMVLLGGSATVFGPVVGAAVFLLLEAFLAAFKPGWFPSVEHVVTEYWLGFIGAFIIFVVLTSRKGIYGHLAGKDGS